MLKQVFETDPIQYYTTTTHQGSWSFPGVSYREVNHIVVPYVERIAWPTGMFVWPLPTLTSPHCILLAAVDYAAHWPSWEVSAHKFDSGTGAYLRRVNIAGGIWGVTTHDFFITRMNRMYQLTWGGFTLQEVTYVETPNGTSIEEVEGSVIPPARFGLVGWITGQAIGIDEQTDTFMYGGWGGNNTLKVHKLSTGELDYTITMPGEIRSLMMEDAERIYILCAGRTIVLLNYVTGHILGASKLPPAIPGSTNTVITWDRLYRRFLIFDQVPDNVDGSCASRIRGYRFVPVPERITTPIPLIVPRKGRTIPVMAQVVSDLNEGVGGYVISSRAIGAGYVAGLPITDNIGRAITQVYCSSTGPVHIVCSAKVDTYSVPSIVPRPIPPLPPDEDDLPPPPNPIDPGATAPNMLSTIQSVYDSQTWRLAEIYEDEPDGRGAFTGACVTAMHAISDSWGHIRKNPGQNQYQGHAVDAINWKRPDNLTAEIYDIVSGSGSIGWGFVDGSPANLSLWYY